MTQLESKTEAYVQRLNSLDSKDLHPLQALMSRAINEEITPGLAVWIGIDPQQDSFRAEKSFYLGRHHSEPLSPKVSATSIFDLASLTKPLACAAWFAHLVSSAQLDPHAEIQQFIPCEDQTLGKAKIWRLSNHSSGLPAHQEYHRGLIAQRLNEQANPVAFKKIVRRMISSTATVYLPGEKSIYSDLGYLLLEWICEKASGETLDEYWQKQHKHSALHFRPLSAETATQSVLNTFELNHYLPTERCSWRKKLLQGEVHDDNAWFMGGVCGHAGLFGTARATGLEGAQWLKAYQGEDSHLKADSTTIQWMLNTEHRAPNQGSFVLGWDTPSVGYSSAGNRFH
jgi:CubicO group peptidase (beta-lactamase class C family)